MGYGENFAGREKLRSRGGEADAEGLAAGRGGEMPVRGSEMTGKLIK